MLRLCLLMWTWEACLNKRMLSRAVIADMGSLQGLRLAAAVDNSDIF